MYPKSTVAALLAGAVGAVVWAVVIWLFHYELGLIAWGIGLIVGLASATFGGSGKVNGAMCAVIALLAIFGGKVGGERLLIKESLRDFYVSMELSEDEYAWFQAGVQGFLAVESDDELKEYILDHGFADAPITEEDIHRFREVHAPHLSEFADREMDYDEWREWRRPLVEERADEFANAMEAEVGFQDLVEAARSDLGIVDIIFALAGVLTAFHVGSGRPADDKA